jgi:hypothetical protein
MITPYTERQKALIVKNILAACEDIEMLNNTGYKFIMSCSGFIAHYDLNGFKSTYSNDRELIHDIIMNGRYNQYNNFHSCDKDYAYYMSKKDIYNTILKELTNVYSNA